MNVFLAEIKDLKEQLISVGEVIPDHSLLQTVLDALPESYETFASTWRLVTEDRPDAVKYDTLVNKLLQEAQSRHKTGLDNVQLIRHLWLHNREEVARQSPLMFLLILASLPLLHLLQQVEVTISLRKQVIKARKRSDAIIVKQMIMSLRISLS